jgi:nucleotide-binding universal stress UspA family protein
MKARTVAVCYDDAPEAAAAAAWAAAAFAAPGDELHLIGIAAAAALLPPVPPISPVGIGGASTVQALHEAWREESERVAQALEREATALGARATPPTRHTLAAAGGASGVGAAAVEWADARRADALVLGRRGLGAVRAAAYAAVGLGSVSSWVLHNAKTPVVVVPRGAPAPSSGGVTWVVAVDDSPHAARALSWAIARAAGPADGVHCVAAATPAP